MKTLSTLEFTEKYTVLLQSLETIVSIFYDHNLGTTDYDILTCYEAISKNLKAKLTNFPLPIHKLNGISSEIYATLLPILESQPYSDQESQDCIKLLIKSVKRWNEKNGPQGYLRFISRFVQL